MSVARAVSKRHGVRSVPSQASYLGSELSRTQPPKILDASSCSYVAPPEPSQNAPRFTPPRKLRATARGARGRAVPGAGPLGRAVVPEHRQNTPTTICCPRIKDDADGARKLTGV